jgi:hypothetical protein
MGKLDAINITAQQIHLQHQHVSSGNAYACADDDSALTTEVQFDTWCKMVQV